MMSAIGNAVAIPFANGVVAYGPPPFNPLNEPDLSFWFDSLEDVSVDGSNGVTSWVDQSPFALEITQETADARPILTPDSTPNGSPAVVFDGIDDFLRLTQSSLDSNRTTYLVLAVESVSDGAHLFDGAATFHAVFNQGSDLNYMNITTRPRPANGSFFFAAIVDDGTTPPGDTLFQVNSGSSSANPAVTVWDGFTVGMSRAPFNTANSNISVCSILQYTAAHSPEKIAQFYDFLSARYGF